jgi:hypothetical protein
MKVMHSYIPVLFELTPWLSVLEDDSKYTKACPIVRSQKMQLVAVIDQYRVK